MTVEGGRRNGLISLSAGSGGIVREAPRVTISLTKYNLTHDMVLASGVFVMHLLGNDDEVIVRTPSSCASKNRPETATKLRTIQ